MVDEKPDAPRIKAHARIGVGAARVASIRRRRAKADQLAVCRASDAFGADIEGHVTVEEPEEANGGGEACAMASGAIDDAGGAEDIFPRLERLTGLLIQELERLSASAAMEGSYDKKSIDSLSSLLGIAERVDKLLAARHKSSPKKEDSNEDMAAAFALVDARIVELACELAATMVDPEFFTRSDQQTGA